MRYAVAGDLPVEPQSAGWLAALGGVVGAALGAFGLWLANRTLGRAAFQTAINNGFKELTDQLQEERNALLKQLSDERLASEAERASLRGEIRNLTQVVESLKALLRANGIEVPELRPRATVANPPPPMVELRGGDPGGRTDERA